MKAFLRTFFFLSLCLLLVHTVSPAACADPVLTAAGSDTHILGLADDLSFRCTDVIEKVYVGNTQLTSSSDFCISADGETVTLYAAYLNQRSPAAYTLHVYDHAGVPASAVFTIVEASPLIPGVSVAADCEQALRFVAPADGYYYFYYENGSTGCDFQFLDEQTGAWEYDMPLRGRKYYSAGKTVYLRPIYDQAASGKLRVAVGEIIPPAQDSIEVGAAYDVTNQNMTMDFTLSVTENSANNGYSIGLRWGPSADLTTGRSEGGYEHSNLVRNNETLTHTFIHYVPGQSFYYQAILTDSNGRSVLAEGSKIHFVRFDDSLTGFEPLSLNTAYAITNDGWARFYFEAPADGVYAVTADGLKAASAKENGGYPIAGTVEPSGCLCGVPVKAGERIYITTTQDSGRSGSVGVYEGLLKLPGVKVGTQGVENIGWRVPMHFTAPEDGEYSFSSNSSEYMFIMDEAGSYLYNRGEYFRTALSKGQVLWIGGMERAPGVSLTVVHEAIPLRKLVFPEELSHLEDEACRGLPVDDVVFGDKIQSIGSKAFADCPNLRRVEIPVADVIIEDDAFDNSSNIILYAPIGGSVEQYATERAIAFEAMLP